MTGLKDSCYWGPDRFCHCGLWVLSLRAPGVVIAGLTRNPWTPDRVRGDARLVQGDNRWSGVTTTDSGDHWPGVITGKG